MRACRTRFSPPWPLTCWFQTSTPSPAPVRACPNRDAWDFCDLRGHRAPPDLRAPGLRTPGRFGSGASRSSAGGFVPLLDTASRGSRGARTPRSRGPARPALMGPGCLSRTCVPPPRDRDVSRVHVRPASAEPGRSRAHVRPVFRGSRRPCARVRLASAGPGRLPHTCAPPPRDRSVPRTRGRPGPVRTGAPAVPRPRTAAGHRPRITGGPGAASRSTAGRRPARRSRTRPGSRTPGTRSRCTPATCGSRSGSATRPARSASSTSTHRART